MPSKNSPRPPPPQKKKKNPLNFLKTDGCCTSVTYFLKSPLGAKPLEAKGQAASKS